MAYEWIYEHNADNSSRYVLGIKGERPLFCFGINPSTAAPNALDPTLKRVQHIAANNGYDSWIMFNIYPKRDTRFDALSQTINEDDHKQNLLIIRKILQRYPTVDIWLAFGNHIYDRAYFSRCLADIYKTVSKQQVRWLSVGRNKSGAPKHPLYQKRDAALIPFDMDAFMRTLRG